MRIMCLEMICITHEQQLRLRSVDLCCKYIVGTYYYFLYLLYIVLVSSYTAFLLRRNFSLISHFLFRRKFAHDFNAVI